MSLAAELEKLERLFESGALSEAEYADAKRRVIEAEGAPARPGEGRDDLGRAANRFVTFQIGFGLVAIVIGLIVFFAFSCRA